MLPLSHTLHNHNAFNQNSNPSTSQERTQQLEVGSSERVNDSLTRPLQTQLVETLRILDGEVSSDEVSSTDRQHPRPNQGYT